MKQVRNFKYLGINLRERGTNPKCIIIKICKQLGKAMVKSLVSIDVKFGFLERGTKKKDVIIKGRL